MAIFCTNCGNKLADGAVFCTECGTKLTQEQISETAPEAQITDIVCKKCGKKLEEGVAFCTECGTPAGSSPAPASDPAPAPATVYTQPQPAYTPQVQYVQSAPAPAPAPDPTAKVVSTGAFFGMNFLFGIPVIGWLACIIMSFAPKNKNIKHYARAMLIWLLIGLALAAGIFFFFKWLGGVIGDFIGPLFEEFTSQFSGLTEGLGGLGDIVGGLGELGDLADGLGDMSGGLPIE